MIRIVPASRAPHKFFDRSGVLFKPLDWPTILILAPHFERTRSSLRYTKNSSAERKVPRPPDRIFCSDRRRRLSRSRKRGEILFVLISIALIGGHIVDRPVLDGLVYRDCVFSAIEWDAPTMSSPNEQVTISCRDRLSQSIPYIRSSCAWKEVMGTAPFWNKDSNSTVQ